MKQTTLKITLAGLLHDIGKFSQGCLDVSKDYLICNAGQYQPTWKGRHTHIHATYTAAFIEQMADRLPKVFNSPDWGKGDSFVNLAAGHHNPETPLQWVIAQADRISSGLDRATFEDGEKIAFQDFKKTRLLPILESLGHKRHKKYTSAEDYDYRYPLAPISAENIFPIRQKGKQSKSAAKQDYQLLFDDFIQKLKGLQSLDTNIELWSQHFDSLLMTYTSMIPAARVNDVVHDVSLYDHGRTTAAMASALYLYHEQQGSLEIKAITDNSPEKFLLITGDFYGIQNFIFNAGGELNRNRSKILRGRSFAVSLFSELAAAMVCESLGLSSLSVILSAGGKFTILAPNSTDAKTKIGRVEEEINEWLFKISYGQSSLGITSTSASPAEFCSSSFSDLWNDKHQPNMEKKKFRKIDLNRYGGVVEDYLDQFNNDLAPHQICPVCGKRPSHKSAVQGDFVSCRICRDHIMLGTFLVKNERLAVFPKSAHLKSHNSLLEPIFGKYQLCFTSEAADDALKLFDFQIIDDGTLPCAATTRLINGYVPVYSKFDADDDRLAKNDDQPIKEDNPVTFNHLAAKAKQFKDNGRIKGVEALGVLKADVDNLGILMGTGLSKERFTVSRLATISRQLNNFFTVYLPHLLRSHDQFRNIYTVFAGGDDLFLIGPWRIMADLALELRERFADYVCHNEQITFSAGITVQKAHTPVDKLAEAAEEALEEAKDQGRNRITMFTATVTWDEFANLKNYKKTMESWLKEKIIARGMMYRFNQFIEMVRREKTLIGKNVVIGDLECLKWHAMFKYSVARNINSQIKREERQQAIKQISQMAAWLEKYGEAVRIPLWHLLYERR